MLVSDFSFSLPGHLIARYPAERRDESRLMHLERSRELISEIRFDGICGLLEKGDLLVLNNTRVIPARLFGRKPTGGAVEIFLVEEISGAREDNLWRCMLRASKSFRPGQLIQVSDAVSAEVVSRGEGDQDWLVSFHLEEDFHLWLERNGNMPIPPYLGRSSEEIDRERYQTVYAGVPGAVAAPTAGLHFTRALMERLALQGVGFAEVTLHVGLGTFQPVRVEKVQDHRIHSERYLIPDETVRAISTAKASGNRVIAVGTTAARTLEYAADENGIVMAGSGSADIFIYPGYRFRVIDGLLTNFHLPESTLLMLVAAFAGRKFTIRAYEEAVLRQFRFYSYGDAMLIV